MTPEWCQPVDAGLRLRHLLRDGELDLPMPASGQTVGRLRRLLRLAEVEDVSVARLAEAHCDAVAIAAEANRVLPADALAGVWASRYAGTGLAARATTGGGWHLSGVLEFCSGAGIVDVALVDVDVSGAAKAPRQLFAVDVRRPGITVDLGSWRTPALAAAATAQVRFDVDVDAEAPIGEPGFYLDRPGFWHGAIGVAACWAGAAHGVYARIENRVNVDNAHAAAHLGRAWSACWMLDAVIERAGRDIDEDPLTVDMAYALAVRDRVVSGCQEVMESAQRAGGPGPMVFDRSYAQRLADLRLYLEQHHHEGDLAEIGRHRPPRPTRPGS